MMPLSLTMNSVPEGISHHLHHHHFIPPSTLPMVTHRQRHMSHDYIMLDQQHNRRQYNSDPFTSLPSSPDEKVHHNAGFSDMEHTGVDLSYDHGGHDSGILRIYGRSESVPSARVVSPPTIDNTAHEMDALPHASAMAHAMNHPVPGRSMTSGGLWVENLTMSPNKPQNAAARSRASSVPPAGPDGAGVSGFMQYQFPAQDTSSDQCAVCGDKATGKHYGAASCDGCKGFFRRSIRKNQKYACRSKRNCPVDKERRNQCRYCRLIKCLRTGMKREAVQNERDRISSRKSTGDDRGAKQLTIEALLQAESVLMLTRPPSSEADFRQKRLATIDDVTESATAQLLNLVQWAKLIPSFNDLKMNDKISLLKAHAGEHLILGLTRRSMELKGVLLLSNDTIIDRSSDEQRDLFSLGARVVDELVDPLNEVAVDDTEFACLRAFVFFDPYVKGIEEKEKVKEVRNEVLVTLEDYVAYRMCDQRGRFGKLFGVLMSLQSIKQQLIEDIIQYTKLFGKAKLDSLLREMLLGEDNPAVEDMEKMTYQTPPVAIHQENFYHCGNMSGTATPQNLGSQSPEATPAMGSHMPQHSDVPESRQFAAPYPTLPVADMGLMNGGEPPSDRYYGPRRNFLLQYQSEQQHQLLAASRQKDGDVEK